MSTRNAAAGSPPPRAAAVTGRQVTIGEADALCIAAALAALAAWLRGAPDPVIASLAASAYGEPAPRTLGWARELISNLGYYAAAMHSAVRAGDSPGEDPPF